MFLTKSSNVSDISSNVSDILFEIGFLTHPMLTSSMFRVVRHFFLLYTLLTVLHAPVAAQQADPEQILQQAEKYFEALEYEAALKAFISIHQVQNATPMQRARSFLYMGVCFTALGNAENAVQSFIELLKIKPEFRLPPGISPSVHAMFKQALERQKLPEKAPPPTPGPGPGKADPPKTSVSLEASAPKKIIIGNPVEVKITLKDPKKLVTQLIIHWRRVGGPDFSELKIKVTSKKKTIVGLIPGALIGSKPGRLHYVVEAKDKEGTSLAKAGSMSAPLSVRLKAPPAEKSSWGWYALGIGGGLAVVGGVVAAILLTRNGSDPNPNSHANVSIILK